MTRHRPDRYGCVAVILHWAIAAAIFGLLASGFAAAGATDPAVKAAILRAHLPLGAAVLALTLLRLVRTLRELRAGTRPGPVEDVPRWQHLAARATHVLLYVVPLGAAASGIGLVALSGAGPLIFGGGTLPDFWAFAPRIPHGIGARLLVLLVAIHTAAALYHHFVRRDGLLRRMWPVSTASASPHQP